MQHYKIEGLI